MEYTIVEMPERVLVGPVVRTANDSPSCPTDILGLWQRFSALPSGAIADAVVAPYACYGLYYGYERDGVEYDLMVGNEVPPAAAAPEGLERRVVPAGRYAKFEIRDGHQVNAVMAAWEEIIADEELSAKRAWTEDFEAYFPAEDPEHADVDILVALA